MTPYDTRKTSDINFHKMRVFLKDNLKTFAIFQKRREKLMTATDIIVFVHNHDMTRQNFDLLAVKMLTRITSIMCFFPILFVALRNILFVT